MLTMFRIDEQRQECLKGTMGDAQIATCAILLRNGNHGLAHAFLTDGVDFNSVSRRSFRWR